MQRRDQIGIVEIPSPDSAAMTMKRSELIWRSANQHQLFSCHLRQYLIGRLPPVFSGGSSYTQFHGVVLPWSPIPIIDFHPTSSRGSCVRPRMRSDAFSAIMMVGALVLPPG